MFHVCLCYVVLSVPSSYVITCKERADPFARLCVLFSCVWSLSHMVWFLIYRNLIFAFFLSPKYHVTSNYRKREIFPQISSCGYTLVFIIIRMTSYKYTLFNIFKMSSKRYEKCHEQNDFAGWSLPYFVWWIYIRFGIIWVCWSTTLNGHGYYSVVRDCGVTGLTHLLFL